MADSSKARCPECGHNLAADYWTPEMTGKGLRNGRRLLYLAVAVIGAGVAYEFGVGWGLIIGGILLSVAFAAALVMMGLIQIGVDSAARTEEIKQRLERQQRLATTEKGQLGATHVN